MADLAPTLQTPAPTVDPALPSVDATIDSTGFGGTSSSCNNNNVVETSGLTFDAETEKALEYAEELMERGSKANKDEDYVEATDCFSRALEIRAAHYGELAPECVRLYYKYGCALLYKAQEESDPLVSGSVPKKEVSTEHDSAKGAESGEASVSSKAKEGNSDNQGVSEDGGDEDQEEDDEASDAEEDESDLDLAWKMLDVARATAEKQPGDTIEKVDILSALAEVALEREDIDTSLGDYLKALSMLERVAEPDSRHIAELNFRICLCLEIASKGEEAIPYCQKAISVCKSRLQRLKSETERSSGNAESPALLSRQSSSTSQTTDSVADKEKEIEILTGLSSELEKKLEDLQQTVSNPSIILSDILGMIAAKGKGGQTSGVQTSGGGVGGSTSSRVGMMANSSGFESPTVSTAHTNGDSGVTHLGVAGRGVKRVSVSSVEPPAKKIASDLSADNGGSV